METLTSAPVLFEQITTRWKLFTELSTGCEMVGIPDSVSLKLFHSQLVPQPVDNFEKIIHFYMTVARLRKRDLALVCYCVYITAVGLTAEA